MKTQRNKWRILRGRSAVTGMWIVGEELPADAGWYSVAIFHTWEAAIIYATRRAHGRPHAGTLAHAAKVDAVCVLSRGGGLA